MADMEHMVMLSFCSRSYLAISNRIISSRSNEEFLLDGCDGNRETNYHIFCILLQKRYRMYQNI